MLVPHQAKEGRDRNKPVTAQRSGSAALTPAHVSATKLAPGGGDVEVMDVEDVMPRSQAHDLLPALPFVDDDAPVGPAMALALLD